MATDSYLNNPNGKIVQENSVYYDAFTLTAGKTIQDVTLPSSANMSVFTLGVG